ncbi:MAG: ketosteroid isomerase [Acidimicrobiales bacterium]
MTSGLTDAEKVAIGQSYADATRAGDTVRIAALTEPDAVVWHSFDERVVDRATTERTTLWLRRVVPDITWDDVALEATAAGFVWQAVMRGTAPGGPLRAHTCLVVTLSPAGRIVRTDEYVDSAQLRPLTVPAP